MNDNIKHKAEEGLGAAKEKFGDVTDDEELQAEGEADQTKANFKQAGDKVKDAAENVKDAFK
jgi:uncharacterized protein YjbJ (UPF0337 family)